MENKIQIKSYGDCPTTNEKGKEILINYKHVYDVTTGGDYERVGLDCPNMGICTKPCPIFFKCYRKAKNVISTYQRLLHRYKM